MQRFCVVALIGLLLSACAPKPTAPTPFAPRLERTACAADLVMPGRELVCATMHVAQNPMSHDGVEVSFPVVVVKAATAASTMPPVFYLHGGPGGDIVEALPVLLGRPWARALIRADRDWVFFDQRGAGLSKPLLDCGTLSLTDAGIANDADLAAFEACARNLQSQGVDFRHYNVMAIADDLQKLREALGYRQFDLYGVSYGSRVALGIAQTAPEGLRAIVLDSPYPPEAHGTQELPRIVAGLTRDLLRPVDGLSDRFGALLQEWETTPPPGLSVDDVGQFLVDALYDSQGVATLKETVLDWLKGDVSRLRAYVETRSGYAEAQNIAHLCKEDFPFESRERMRLWGAADPIARSVVGAAMRYYQACDSIDVGPPSALDDLAYTGAVPTLFLVAGVDPGCPLEFSEPAAKAAAAAQLVVFPARTHGIVRQSPCGLAMVKAFLDNPTAPVNKACLSSEPPPL